MAQIDNILYINTSSISVLISTGSLYGSSSWSNNALSSISSSYSLTSSLLIGSVVSASYSNTSSYASTFIGNIINSQLPSQINVTGISASFTGSLTGSLYGTSSYSTTASYFKMFPNIKSGKISSSLFGGTPLTSSITFNTSYSNNTYAVSVIGGDNRSWTLEQVSASSFIISTNSTQPLTDYVYWVSMYNGESV